MRVTSVLFLSLCLLQQPSKPQITQRDKPYPSTKTESETPNGYKGGGCSNGAIDRQPQKTQAAKDEDAAEKRLYHRYLWATIIGAGGSMAVIALLVWQNVLTRKVANAAQTSADTIKNIERPWILISETSMEVEHVKAPEGKWDNRTSVVWKFKNFGKTPAFIVDISGGIKILPSLDTAYAPIYEPPYSGPNDPVIAPAEESGYIIFIIPTTMVVREQMDITVDKLFLIFSGRITYKDTFGDGSMHESKFCLRYCNRPRGFHLMFGRQEYNEYT